MAELAARVSAAIRSLDEVVSSPCAPKGIGSAHRRDAPGSAVPESGRKRSRLEALVDLYTTSSAASSGAGTGQTSGQSSFSSSNDGGSGPAAPPPSCRPWDRQDFWERAETFRVHTWFGKPPAVSPLECARFGWTNSGRDTLQCRLCAATLYFPVATNTALVGTAALDVAARDFRRQLRSGHAEVCPWRCKGATSPAHFASVIPVAPSSASANMFLATKHLASAVAAAAPEAAARVAAATSALCSELESTLWSSASSMRAAGAVDGGALVAGVASLAGRVMEAVSASAGAGASTAAPSLRARALSALIAPGGDAAPALAACRAAVVLALTGWRAAATSPARGSGGIHLHCSACNRTVVAGAATSSITGGPATSPVASSSSPHASPPATPSAGLRSPVTANLLSAAKAASEAAARASAVFRRTSLGASAAVSLSAASGEPVAKRLRLGGEEDTAGGAGAASSASSLLPVTSPTAAYGFHPLRSHAWYCPITRPVVLSSGSAAAVSRQLAAIASFYAADASAPSSSSSSSSSTTSAVDASRGSVVEALTMVTEAAFGGADPGFVLGLVGGGEGSVVAGQASASTARGAFDGDDDTVDEADGAAVAAAAAGASAAGAAPAAARLPGWALLALLAAATTTR